LNTQKRKEVGRVFTLQNGFKKIDILQLKKILIIITKMNSSIETILKQTYSTGVYHTHVSLIEPRGKFLFSRQVLEEFWNHYCHDIEKKNFVYGLAEKPQQYVPVLADVDLKIEAEDGMDETKPIYGAEQVKKVVQIYQKVINDIVEDVEEKDLLCVLLEKPPYLQAQSSIGKMYIKNGFHLHFPNVFLDKADQEALLIPRVVELMKKEKIFEYLGYENSGTVIDKQCCTVPWLLYGSKKEAGKIPYTVSKIFSSSYEEVSLEDAFKHYLIYDAQGKAIPSLKEKISFYLPRILSILPYSREPKQIRTSVIPTQFLKPEKVKEQKVYDKLTVVENLKVAEKLLPMLSMERCNTYNEWMTVGWVLFNISEGSDGGLQLWLSFSSRAKEKFDARRCHTEWQKMKKTDMTIGTLKYYASIDNPERYKEFKREVSEKLVQESISGSHNDIAKILFAEYGNEFVCASVANKVWYQFIGHRWECIEEGVFLREKISSVIVNMFKEKRRSVFGTDEAPTDDNDDDEDEKKRGEKVKQLSRIIKDLKNASFKDNVMKEAREVFYDKRFRDKLDNNPYLIAFKNGVYDLKEDVFRNGRPEDFMSKSMPINYALYSETDEKVIDVYNFLEKVFPDTSVRAFFLDTSSEIFVGGNHRKIFQMWTGEGDNGKSVTQMFFENMLGNSLSIKIPTTLVCSKKPLSGSAWPELARAGGGVRAAWIEEIDESEEIFSGIVKHLTGNDSFVARDLFEKGKDMKEIKPMFKLFFICNKPVNFVGGGDKALWNRARVIPFESTFCRPCNPAPDTFEEQLRQKRFPMDNEFAQKIPGLVEAFAWVLLQHRKKPKLAVEPEKVRSATNAYRQRNDVYRQFIEECIKESPDATISLSELYSQLKDWFKDGIPGHKPPKKDDVKQYFIKAWGDMEIGMKWKGYRIKNLQDEIESGNAFILEESDLVDYGKPPM
jgi:phage/plasmid-associated DNA primase